MIERITVAMQPGQVYANATPEDRQVAATEGSLERVGGVPRLDDVHARERQQFEGKLFRLDQRVTLLGRDESNGQATRRIEQIVASQVPNLDGAEHARDAEPVDAIGA